MVDNPNNAELLNLLGQAREQAKFFGELGAESIAPGEAAGQPLAVTRTVKADETRRSNAQPAREESMLFARTASGAKSYVSRSTEPSNALFDVSEPQPSFA